MNGATLVGDEEIGALLPRVGQRRVPHGGAKGGRHHNRQTLDAALAHRGGPLEGALGLGVGRSRRGRKWPVVWQLLYPLSLCSASASRFQEVGFNSFRRCSLLRALGYTRCPHTADRRCRRRPKGRASTIPLYLPRSHGASGAVLTPSCCSSLVEQPSSRRSRRWTGCSSRGGCPRPIERFFETVRFAQSVFFGDPAGATEAIERINRIHRHVEDARGEEIPQ